jgi:predicted Zn-dependent protease
MTTEADFAFRQAFAICPGGAEIIMRYADLLMAMGRGPDALSVVSIGCQFNPEHPSMHQLLEQLRAKNSPPK